MTNHPRSPRQKFKVGQVVFVPDEGEYEVVKRIGPQSDLGKQEVECFNARWGGCDIHRFKDVRPLTKKEAGR